MTINLDDIKNGYWWKSPSLLIACSVWLDGDEWILLGDSTLSVDREGTIRNALSFDNAEVVVSKERLRQRLEKNGWVRIYESEELIAERLYPKYIEKDQQVSRQAGPDERSNLPEPDHLLRNGTSSKQREN